MSNVPQKKTAPPGSWPWDKGEDTTAQTHAQGEPAATPRSPPAVPEYQGFNGGGSSVGETQSGEYTHQDPGSKDKGKSEGQEEAGKEEEPIRLKDVEPKPVDEKTAEQDVAEKDQESKTGGGQAGNNDIEAAAAEQADPNAELTEKAKQTFDQASENQPTSNARDEFLNAARNNLAAPLTESPGPQENEKVAVPETREEDGEHQPTAQDQPNEPASDDQQPEGVQEEASVAEAGQGGDGETKPDFSVLKDGVVNKGGNVVLPDGAVVGRVVEGEVRHLMGKQVDETGNIWNSSGKVVGRAEPIPDSERDAMLRGSEPAPFESFPDAVVDGDGMVVASSANRDDIVGRVVLGDKSVLRGKSVDADGDILDRVGNVIGKAERWEPEPEKEPEPEPEVDKSALAGKRVNKAGNVVDENGTIFGRVVEGDVKRMVGRMCDKKGNVLSESGDVLGMADLVPEGEREGLKEGPFAELQGCTIAKDGTVVTPAGDVVGRLTSGDAKVLFGRAVDEDGDILDKNGNVVGKAERWEPEKVERKKNPMSGRRVNREGNVVDEDGNLIGKLTSGDLSVCSGKDIDDDGDVVDYKGNTVGHCSLLEDIPKEEESPKEKEKREQAERDKKLAVQMSVCIEQCLDSIRPICKMITEKIDKAERTPEDERDEEALVQEVRPLIEEGGRILNEAKGIIKGLDPDGRVSANAKHKTAAREATPEEYHLAEVLKDLTGDVTQCIDNAKRKLEDMPHAKKELNPLWGLLNEPLFQILAAVGLLLTGVLNLVGRLLSGLGLGGLVDGLLGTLGLNRVLESLGLGSFSKSLKSGKKGGLLGGVLGG
ncbi:hypothetical protein C7999DRAFT_34774 [Corynascus novoguineensis]|uniref:DUF6987 domain-containing protein n=1 Tax=Corynascus novoguineensis TaxID=1126955 RepID=A0AAN7CNA4_9PEZI|nr:hypothetical protein C7999DRAFT_34774 [Corynascus novoguineensis]